MPDIFQALDSQPTGFFFFISGSLDIWSLLGQPLNHQFDKLDAAWLFLSWFYHI